VPKTREALLALSAHSEQQSFLIGTSEGINGKQMVYACGAR
jgi:hypothetical protein